MIPLLFALSFSEVKPILDARCVKCHNQYWPDKNWQKEELVIKNKDKIIFKLLTQAMPPNNITGMTEHERNFLVYWLRQQ